MSETATERDGASVRILVTGGTLDKAHDPLTESFGFQSGATHLPRILAEARTEIAVQTLFLKDSAEFTDADRAAIGQAIVAASEDRIVVTHGTSTMGETARALEPVLLAEAPQKTIVLTGAMRPFSFGASDAAFNLGGAVIAAQIAPPGVYAVMNGRIFSAAAVRKNVALGRFDR